MRIMRFIRYFCVACVGAWVALIIEYGADWLFIAGLALSLVCILLEIKNGKEVRQCWVKESL